MANRPLRLDPDEEWCDERVVHALYWGKAPEKRVTLRASMGSQAADFLWSTFVGYVCISKRLVSLLSANNISGWRTYDVAVYGRNNEPLPHYYGLVITGATIPWDRGLSTIVTRVYVEGAKPVSFRKGMYFDCALWDKSDFFWVNGSKVVTGSVQKLFKKAKITNVLLTALEDVEESLTMDDFLPR